ncbi:MAG: glycosyltransferase family 9 protein [Planctomycetota bacterium]
MNAFLTEKRRRPDGPLLALAVAAAYGPAKEWPVENYAQLIDLLTQTHRAECVLVGAPSERRKSEEVIAQSKAGAVLATGETSVGEALALLSLCAGFAGNDSGSMHVAGALGMPTVGIFGSTRADRTGPLGPLTQVLYKPLECSPCLKRVCRFGQYDCLKQIKPQDVLAALESLGVFNAVQTSP